MKYSALFACAALVVALLGGGTQATSADTPSPAPSASPAAVVRMKNFAFVPQTVTIHAGQSVQWVNDDNVSHSATADDRSWNSGELDQGQSWTYTFSAAGTYKYYCDDHEFMKGTVVVQ
jgi:plastocyanin